MAKGTIIKNLRVTGGSMRLRDSLTGERVDIAITRRSFVAGET